MSNLQTKIPITDLSRQFQCLEHDLMPVIHAVCVSGQYIKGPFLKGFEEKIAAYLGVKYAIGVNSGTDALFLALKALGIGPGDQVITTAMSYIATAEAISLTGAEPIFVDILPQTGNLDVDQIEALIGPRTRALLPVHLHGYPCDMTRILELAQKYGLRVIEDCAQAIGAEFSGHKLGSLADLGCFSFFPTKNLGCIGDGGLITTQNPDLYEQLLLLREHGCPQKNVQQILGVNSRLDSIQAAVLGVKLDHLDQWNQRRREWASAYDTELAHLPVVRPPLQQESGSVPVFHHYCIQLNHRDLIQTEMARAGIECLAYYPVPLHRQKLYQHTYRHKTLPHAESYAKNNLALPLFPELTRAELNRIVSTLETQLMKSRFDKSTLHEPDRGPNTEEIGTQ